jgi:ParB family transcriptional regulator, chromosome partitioning protein
LSISAEDSKLKSIPTNRIGKNPENPRLLFRHKEFEELLESIRLYGIQVPISVYEDGDRYVLIDGERRWRCCLKLNYKTIPALIQVKPSPLTNLLLMFNIHALREQWDFFSIASKLPVITEMLANELKRPPLEREIVEKTGLRQGMIRRCKMLMQLPQEYLDMLRGELSKPKSKQKLSEDFFFEMERSIRAVENNMPSLISDKNIVRDNLIKKYKNDVINNIVHFRQIGKIANAGNVDANIGRAHNAIRSLIEDNNYSIEDAYEDSVSSEYSTRDLLTSVQKLLEKLENIDFIQIGTDVDENLQILQKKIESLLMRGGQK